MGDVDEDVKGSGMSDEAGGGGDEDEDEGEEDNGPAESAGGRGRGGVVLLFWEGGRRGSEHRERGW